jgi:dynein heavy chain
MDLWTKLTEDKPSIEAKLGPLEDKFKLLDEYSIILKEEDILRRNNLRDAWLNFNLMLDRI